MKLITLFLMVSQLSFAQIWVESLDDAKKMAKATNKFILIDFTATWCKPCKKMEQDFWHNANYKTTLDKFIIVPVDFDRNKDLVQRYNVRSIPNVKLVDMNGDMIYEALGFSNAAFSNKEFEGFPGNSQSLYKNLIFKDKKNPTDEELFNLATSYQVLLQISENNARNSFLRLSNNFFDKCIKKTSNISYMESSELGKLFNFALTDSGQKVVKKLEISKVSDENKPFAYYILAKANYQENNKEEAEKNILEIEKTGIDQWIYAAKILKEKYSLKK